MGLAISLCLHLFCLSLPHHTSSNIFYWSFHILIWWEEKFVFCCYLFRAIRINQMAQQVQSIDASVETTLQRVACQPCLPCASIIKTKKRVGFAFIYLIPLVHLQPSKQTLKLMLVVLASFDKRFLSFMISYCSRKESDTWKPALEV